MVKHTYVAPLRISLVTTQQFLQVIAESLQDTHKKTFVTTPNSEFLYAALTDDHAEQILNKADIAIADGVGIFWVERFLSIPFYFHSKAFQWCEAFVQMVISGARVLLTPQYLYHTIPEKITGSNVIYDLAQVAALHKKSLYLLGNWGDSAQKTAELLQRLNPGLQIAGFSNKTADDASVIPDIQKAQPDLLMVGFGPIKQEQWIVDHLPELPVRVAIGVGGSFDYASGNKIVPPKWIRDIGLEWLFRLVTQFRFRRVYRAVIGLITETIKYKIKHSTHV